MLKPALQLRTAQQLTMTPHLRQAIRLLLLPIGELRTEMQQALDENVMLEAGPSDPETAAETDDADEWPDAEAAGAEPADQWPDAEAAGVDAADQWPDAEAAGVDAADEWSDAEAAPAAGERTETEAAGAQPDAAPDPADEWADAAAPGDIPANPAPEGLFEYADRSDETLRGHLLWQLELENLDAHTTAIGQAVIDAIDDDGYLTDNARAIQATLAPDVIAREEEIEAAIRRVQGLAPAGVGARSVSESIRLQLAQLEPSTPRLDLARSIATEHLELVAARRTDALERRLDASAAEVAAALRLIRACRPRPGATVHAPAAEYVIPDVFVRRSDGRWIVELNAAVTPRLRINRAYADLLGRGERFSVLRTQLQEAKWLVRSLDIRNATLLKVAEAIVERQTEFLDRGEEFMRPMVHRDIAAAIGMHESTVSRVTANKHMHTPRGMIEFRYFFSSRVDADEGTRSSTAVRARIRRLIAGELADKPLSDHQITRLLASDGIRVARRTVAKYRDGMNIPSSTDRKRAGMA